MFGDPVTIYPGGGSAQTVQAVFREASVEIGSDLPEDGAVVQEAAPTLRVRRDQAGGLDVGDRVDAPNGKTYRCLPPLVSPSPATDALVTYPLELGD